MKIRGEKGFLARIAIIIMIQFFVFLQTPYAFAEWEGFVSAGPSENSEKSEQTQLAFLSGIPVSASMNMESQASYPQNQQEQVEQETMAGVNLAGWSLEDKAGIAKNIGMSASEAAVTLISSSGGSHQPEAVSNALKSAGFSASEVDNYLGNIVAGQNGTGQSGTGQGGTGQGGTGLGRMGIGNNRSSAEAGENDNDADAGANDPGGNGDVDSNENGNNGPDSPGGNGSENNYDDNEAEEAANFPGGDPSVDSEESGNNGSESGQGLEHANISSPSFMAKAINTIRNFLGSIATAIETAIDTVTELGKSIVSALENIMGVEIDIDDGLTVRKDIYGNLFVEGNLKPNLLDPMQSEGSVKFGIKF